MTCLQRIWPFLSILLSLLGLVACAPAPLPEPESSGELVVATLNSPTTYFLDVEGNPSGFEHDLVRQFADSQGWRVKFVLADTLDDLLEIVLKEQAHIAAAGLIAHDERRRSLRFGPTYGQVKEWVICASNRPLPKKIEDLVGLRLEVVAGSSHVSHLQAYRRSVPALQWVEAKVPSSEELLEEGGEFFQGGVFDSGGEEGFYF